jgi:hypothetical protein
MADLVPAATEEDEEVSAVNSEEANPDTNDEDNPVTKGMNEFWGNIRSSVINVRQLLLLLVLHHLLQHCHHHHC